MTPNLKIGDRVTVHIPTGVGKPPRIRNGQITGESRSGASWIVRLDLNKYPANYHKSFVHKSYEEPPTMPESFFPWERVGSP